MRVTLCILFAAAALCVTPEILAREDHTLQGAWDLTLQTDAGPRPSWVKLFREQDTFVAEFVGTGGGKNRAEGVEVDGNEFQWTVGQSTYHATLSEGKLAGHLVQGDRRIPFVGQRVIRRTDVTGKWDLQLDTAQGVLQRVLTLEQDGPRVTGKYKGDQIGEFELSNGTLDHGRLSYTLEMVLNGQDVTLDYDIEVRGDKLDGTVSIRECPSWEGKIHGARQRQWGRPIQLIGNDLSNWDFQRVGGENQWSIEEGVLKNAEKGWNIFSEQRFKDFQLCLDVRVPPHGNSGIYINGRYEVQVADTHGQPATKGGMGAIYGRAVPTSNPSKPPGEWQTFEITFVDYWATVVLNGTKIIDNVMLEGITGGALDSLESEPGPLMLQGDHGPIEYRNIVLTPLID